VVPAWLITTPESSYLILTRDHKQRERLLHLITRFMTWKMATSFVEFWLEPEVTRSGEEALLGRRRLPS